VLVAVYVTAAATCLLLLVASVASHLFFRRPVVELPQSSIVVDNPDPRELLECNHLVLEQLSILSTQTNELFARPLMGEHAGLARDWKHFSTKWRDQWDVIDARCRFSELAETTMGEAYDRMAHVHQALPAMRLKYNSLLATFDREQADELSKMRRALEDSRQIIARKVDSTPHNAAPTGSEHTRSDSADAAERDTP
jgi:hypothetical protein